MRNLLMIALVLGGCRHDDGPTYVGMTEALEASTAGELDSTGLAGTTTATTASDDTTTSLGAESTSTGSINASTCGAQIPCEGNSFCVAAYANAVRGPFECVDACVGPGDEFSWCYDASACCDPAATCTIRGYCIVEGSSGSSGSSGSGGSETGQVE